MNFVIQEHKSKVKQAIINSIKNKDEYIIEYKIKTARNNIKYLQSRGSHFFNAKGKVECSLGSIYDITKLKKSEKKYQEQASYTSNILNSQNNMIIITNGKKILDANNSLLEFFQCENIKQFNERYKSISQAFIPHDEFITQMEKGKGWFNFLKENQQEYINVNIKDKNGTPCIFSVNISKEAVKKNYYVVTLSNITELYRLKNHLEEEIEKQLNINLRQEILLFEQSKMASLGRMIGNISHQWKQPLSIISTIISSLQFKYIFDLKINKTEIIKDTEDILERIDYLTENIDLFKNFLKEEKEFKELKLQDEIDKALKICDITLRDNGIQLRNHIDYEKYIFLELVKGELSEVIINIINNAKDAIKENFVKEGWIQIELFEKNGKIVITIEDNAGGIKEEILPNIFDEYFTTKTGSEGTGLGLHMSKTIIEQSLKGKIHVANTDKGAKFFIEFNSEQF